ncbi:MAG: hypothetical protein PHE53_13645, partial [Thermoguttaceae bacterium]|nr:hypothetical protein [Thermoguttaceae bacterium]
LLWPFYTPYNSYLVQIQYAFTDTFTEGREQPAVCSCYRTVAHSSRITVATSRQSARFTKFPAFLGIGQAGISDR